MTEMSGFIYHEEYLKYQFGFSHPFKPIREKYTLDILKEIEVIDEKNRVYSPETATEADRARELGTDDGRGYSVNIPLKAGTGDEAYLYAFRELVPPLLESYKPEIIINQFGVDGHYEDPLVGLSLTTRAYEEVAKMIHSLAHKLCEGRLLVLGGGGYDIANTSHRWAIMFALICGGVSEKHLERYRQLFDKFPPPENDWVLEMTKSVVEEVKKTIFSVHNIRWQAN